MSPRRYLIIGVVALIGLVAAVAAISAGKSASPAAAPSVAVSGPKDQGSGELGGSVATFTATDIDRRTVRVATGKPGALFFFAGWCGSCLPEAQALDRVQREFGSRADITTIDSDPSDSVDSIRRFRQRVGSPRYPAIWDRTGKLSTQFAVRALDTTIIYNAAGKVVFRDAAPTDLPTLRAAFAKAGVR